MKIPVPTGPPDHVPPPVPAPYLAGVPQLEHADELDDEPSPAAIAEARRTIQRLRQVIRRARENWERSAGVVITVEATWEP